MTQDSISLQKDKRRAFIRRIITYILIIIAVVVVFTIAFRQFKIYSNARLALREAKNIKLSLEMVDTEYYGLGISIYDNNEEGNIKKGALTHVEKLQGELKGTVKLIGYDTVKRIITSMEYENENYIVRYNRSNENETWQVCLIKEILTY